MFGYVTIRKPECKIKDYECYQGFYCGLCQQLKQAYHLLGQVTLTYDMTFLVLFFSSLYEESIEAVKKRCVVHPVKKRAMFVSEVSAYAADMNILLSYYHFLDDFQDDKSVLGFAGSVAYKRYARKVAQRYPYQAKAIRESLKKLARLERENCQDIELVAKPFGELMAGLFRYKKDVFLPTVQKMAYHIGCFIYMMDAYEDRESDREKGRYNPLEELAKKIDFEEKMQSLLLREMEQAAYAFEQLPCLRYQDILRNILYAGVWNRYDQMKERKKVGSAK